MAGSRSAGGARARTNERTGRVIWTFHFTRTPDPPEPRQESGMVGDSAAPVYESGLLRRAEERSAISLAALQREIIKQRRTTERQGQREEGSERERQGCSSPLSRQFFSATRLVSPARARLARRADASDARRVSCYLGAHRLVDVSREISSLDLRSVCVTRVHDDDDDDDDTRGCCVRSLVTRYTLALRT